MEYAQWESYALPSCKGAYVDNLKINIQLKDN